MQRIIPLHYYISAGLLLINLLLAIGTIFWVKQQPTVVSFDKELVVKQFVTQLSHQKITQERMQQLSEQFAKALKESIAAFSKEHKAIVIKKEMAWASNADVTSIIALRVANTMRGAR